MSLNTLSNTTLTLGTNTMNIDCNFKRMSVDL